MPTFAHTQGACARNADNCAYSAFIFILEARMPYFCPILRFLKGKFKLHFALNFCSYSKIFNLMFNAGIGGKRGGSLFIAGRNSSNLCRKYLDTCGVVWIGAEICVGWIGVE